MIAALGPLSVTPEATPTFPVMIPFRKKRSATTATGKALSIVVADDETEIQELVAAWLEECGHVVTRASSGREVVERVREQPVDLVITDIVMPGGNGFDAILAVNRLRPRTRIVAISGGGHNMPADGCLRVAKGVGADVILLKPFRRQQLLDAVNRAAR